MRVLLDFKAVSLWENLHCFISSTVLYKHHFFFSKPLCIHLKLTTMNASLCCHNNKHCLFRPNVYSKSNKVHTRSYMYNKQCQEIKRQVEDKAHEKDGLPPMLRVWLALHNCQITDVACCSVTEKIYLNRNYGYFP